MADERRTDPTWNAIRQNWPILLVVVAGLSTWFQVSNTVATHEKQIADMEKLMNRDAFTKFAIWQTNTTRDIQELKGKCK